MKFTWKKLLSLSLAAVMAMSLAACGQSDATDDSQSAGPNQEETSTPAPTPTPENGEDTSAPDASEPEDSQSGENGGVLVVYYSATGNTEAVAGYIAEATGGDLFELEPAEPYTDEDLNYSNEDSRVSREHEDESLRDVELAADTVENWDEYDTVFIGYPIWWDIAAWSVNDFVKSNDFTGKTVIPFATSANDDIGESGKLLEEMAGTGNWLEGERFSSSVSKDAVTEWIEGLNL